MSGPCRIPIDEVVTFDAVTASPFTGAAADADSTPTFAIYEDTTDTDIGVGGNMTKRTSLTGNYRASFTASAANGFEAGKWYNVISSATVGGVAGKCVSMTFMCVPAENSAGVPKVDVSHLLGTAWLTPGTAGTPDVNVKLWNALATVELPLVPTTAGRKLDVSATGEAGLDFDNIKDATGAHTLTNITVPVVTTTGTATNLTNAPTNGDLTAAMKASVTAAVPTAAVNAAAVWAYVCEGSYTAVQFLRGIASACLGKASGLATTAAVYRDVSDTKDRISATVDANGNRTAVATDLN